MEVYGDIYIFYIFIKTYRVIENVSNYIMKNKIKKMIFKKCY